MSRSSALPPGWRRWIGTGLLALVGALLVLPRPSGWAVEHVWAEDGAVFLVQAEQQGMSAILTHYGGYLHVLPRLLAATCVGIVPLDGYAACVVVSTVAVRWIMAVVAWAVLMPYARSWWWALIVAAGFLLVPAGNREVFGNITNLRWFCTAFIVVAMLGVFRSWWQAVAVGLLLAACTLTDPLAIALVPLALLRLVSAKGWGRLPPAVVTVLAIVHLSLVQAADRPYSNSLISDDPLMLVKQWVVYITVHPLLGEQLGHLLVVHVGKALYLGVVVLLAVLLWRFVRTRPSVEQWVPVAVLAVHGAGLTLGTLMYAPTQVLDNLVDDYAASSRYGATPGLLMGMAILLAVSTVLGRRRRWPDVAVAAVVLVLLAASWVCDADITADRAAFPSWHQQLAQARGQCATGADHATVTISPGWDIGLSCLKLER